MEKDIALMRYPELCEGDFFLRDYALASARLRNQARPFALIHDLRHVSLTSVDRQLFLNDARELGAAGRVSRVAFVLACSPFWQGAISGLVSRFSPVQPARVFNDISKARLWCEDGSTSRNGPLSSSASAADAYKYSKSEI
ncbi:MAG: hypothetical protein SGPRY_013654, partial [Prymnesium sp.]